MPDPVRAQALYRRWRPQTFEDVVGQEHITRTLRNAVAAQRLAHAYLFTGPRGTGKTSVARILAKAINCVGEGDKPCNACSICRGMTEGRSLDLIEIDAASNTGVDDVRDLRDKIGFSPNEARFKVYVVDEVHMLSTAAFNALLKTLEEPPPHAVFVLATTEVHKLPETIVSRCQRHDFRRTPLEALLSKLRRICEAEGITAEPAALEMVARAATGSMRDAESLLDQLTAAGVAVSADYVREVLGTPADSAVAGIVDALADGDAAAGLRLLSEAFDRGADTRHLQGRLLDHLRHVLLVQTGIDPAALPLTDEQRSELRRQAERIRPGRLVRAIHLFQDARAAADLTTPSLPLELAMVEAVLAPEAPAVTEPEAVPVRPETAPRKAAAGAPAATPAAPTSRTSRPARTAPATTPRRATAAAGGPDARPGQAAPASTAHQTPAAPAGPAAAEQADRAHQTPAAPAGPAPEQTAGAPEPAAATPDPGAEAVESPPAGAGAGGPDTELRAARERWPEVCAAVNTRDRNTAALLKDCRPVAADADSVTLGFFYEFHCRRASEPRRVTALAQALEQVLGARRKVRCVVAPLREGEDRSPRPRTVVDQARQDPLVRHAVEELGARISGVTPETDDE